MKYYKGKYKLKNPTKYIGDPKNVVYRSHWEKMVFKWCESNSEVVRWGSEVLVVPYICATDRRSHRYFVDLHIEFKSGKTVCVEIKPKKQTIQPKSKRGKPKANYLKECMTYAKNQSKWEAATKYCNKRGWSFQVWHEETLKSLGIKLLT